MLTSFWKTLVCLGAILFQEVSAQQYLGDYIPNATYPGVPGSELAYFRIKDPAGKNSNLTLVNYYSLGTTGKRLVPSKVKRAVIIIHGLNRDPGTYMSNMLSALSQQTTDSNINFDSVAIMAPSFPNGDDKNVTYPYWDYPPGAKKKASGGAQSWTNLLVWKGSQWAGGGTNQYPVKNPSVSSYEVLDQLVAYFADKTTFPNLNQIVVAGHSLGGQTVQRYAEVGKPLSSLGVTTPVTYWIANPNSLGWLNSSRPLSTASCADYDSWRDGLSNYTEYPSIYNNDLVASGSAAVISNYASKNKAYARGILDMGDDSSGCAPFTTGGNRHERFYYFINWWTPTCAAPNSTSGHCDTVDLINMGHDGGGMMASAAGRARLFTDNFYGDGARSYDFGYPRIQANVDDPYPNPAYNSTSTSQNATVYSGNMTYAGCYTDTGSRTLAVMSYDSTSNTIEKCTAACAAAGYKIAGMEYGSQCWCDNALGPYTTKVLDVGCAQACTGNSSETCGNANRLSVYSNGTPSQASAPSNAEVVGNYYYAGCHTEATSGRALSATSYSDGKNMTLENCASFCNGYKYFGIEYAGECYCGSYFGTGSALASDSSCSMVCTGNSLELCGGSGTLSVYQLESDASVSTIVQGSTTAGTSTSTGTASASAIPSSSLCPATNGQTIADSNNITYTISCSSDTSIGSYSSAQASNSYFDCMTACDSASSSGCVAFTYVGGTYGSGSGTCYLKNSQGSFTSAASNLVSGVKGSASGGVTTTSSAAPAATTYANGSTPVVNGVTYSIQTDTTYSGTLLTLSRKRAATVVGNCLSTCAASTSCVATAFDGSSSTCTYYSAFDNTTKSTAVGTTFATVQSRSTATSTSSSSTGLPSASLCPATNGQTVNNYAVSCSSDTNIGSYSSQQAANSYLDCMSACDSAASTGCVAWTYVGGTYGQGSGTCWLKNSKGSFTSAGTNYIAGMAASQSSSSSSSSVQSGSATSSGSSSVSSTVSASSTATSSTGIPSASLCPSANGQIITDSNGNQYNVTCSADNNVGSYTNAQASTSYLDCMTACDSASSTGCQGFTYVGGAYGSGSGTCWLKQSMSSYPASGNNVISAVKIASSNSGTVSVSSSSSASASSTSSSSTASSSSVSSSSSSSSVSSSSSSSSVSSSSSSSSASSSSSSSTDSSSSTSSTASSSTSSSASSTSSSSSASSTSSSSSVSNTSSSSTASSTSSVTSSSSSVTSSSSSASITSSSSVSSSSATTLSTSTSSTVSSSSSLSLPTGFSSYGCFVDSSTRALSYSAGSSSTNTPYKCASTCKSLGYKYAGTEYGSECYCSNTAPTNSAKASDCNQACSGDSSQICGAGNRLSVYVDSTWTQKFFARSTYGSWNLMACYTDNTNGRLLSKTMSMTGGANNATIANCLDACAKSGLTFCGAEYYQECYGGSTQPSSSLIAGSDPLAAGCNYPCTGNSTEACGGSNKILVYVNNGTLASSRRRF